MAKHSKRTRRRMGQAGMGGGVRATLATEVAAWVADRNAEAVTVDWQFTTADARTKLKHLYPVLLPVT